MGKRNKGLNKPLFYLVSINNFVYLYYKLLTMKKYFELFMTIMFSFLTGAKVVLLTRQEIVTNWDFVHLGINVFFIWFFSYQLYKTIKGE